MPFIIEDKERAQIRLTRAGAFLDPYSRGGAAGYRHAVAAHCELYGDNVTQLETAQWACAIAAGGIRAANRRVESVEIYPLAIGLKLATDRAAIDIPGGGGHYVGDAEHKIGRRRI